MFAVRHLTYDRPAAPTDVPEPPGAEGANTGEATLTNVAVGPMLGATVNFGRLAVGLAVFTPFGGISKWDENDAFVENTQFPGAVDGVQRWYSIEGELRSSYLSGAIAYAFGPLSIGIAPSLVWSVTDTVRAREVAENNNSIENEGRSWLDTESFDFALGAGVLYEAVRRTLWFGASYQSQPNFGSITQDGTLNTLFANGVRTESDVVLHTDLPDIIRAGARYRIQSDIELRLFGDYQRWSVLEHQCVTTPEGDCDIADDGSAPPEAGVVYSQFRDWRDTFGVRAGGSYWVNEGVELFAGTGFSSNAVPDRTLEPALPDFDAVSASLGGRFAVTEPLYLEAAYTHLFYFSRDNRGESVHPNLAVPSTSSSAGGRYSQQVGFLHAAAELIF